MRACNPIIIGLTGSIGMGKSTIAKQCARLGIAVCDSDSLVHKLLGPGGQAVKQVSGIFPSSQEGSSINRKKLGQEVFGNDEKLKKLEAVLHPLVREGQERFIRNARIRKQRIVILDIPLLFETGAQKRCDYTIVATAPAFVQKHRVLKRRHMTQERFHAILSHQMPDTEKRKRADFIVHTGIGKYVSLREMHAIMMRLLKNIG